MTSQTCAWRELRTLNRLARISHKNLLQVSANSEIVRHHVSAGMSIRFISDSSQFHRRTTDDT